MIGYVEIECMIYHTQSLKEKRSVLKKSEKQNPQ
ncbi:uncharacterized protein DUF503 [Melghiribacillus thermohalophilus]|uniref:Uncharacterized protein DUF503 n=1 Tax=Melghiribacillus thermohalophilus TaxID=1324956 RepID=A0A4R3NAW0_9BACI|nr:uncharacterized protein DUF503 [Melghiribacillus thermohalophilus]